MTVEEAIERETKTAGYKKDAADRCREKLNNPNYPWGRDWTKEQVEDKERRYIEEAEEHQQMAEWLKEFRELKEKATAKKEREVLHCPYSGKAVRKLSKRKE